MAGDRLYPGKQEGEKLAGNSIPLAPDFQKSLRRSFPLAQARHALAPAPLHTIRCEGPKSMPTRFESVGMKDCDRTDSRGTGARGSSSYSAVDVCGAVDGARWLATHGGKVWMTSKLVLSRGAGKLWLRWLKAEEQTVIGAGHSVLNSRSSSLASVQRADQEHHRPLDAGRRSVVGAYSTARTLRRARQGRQGRQGRGGRAGRGGRGAADQPFLSRLVARGTSSAGTAVGRNYAPRARFKIMDGCCRNACLECALGSRVS